VEETFSTSADKIDRAFFKFIVPTNSLAPDAFVDWDVLINGILVGSFRINSGQTGPVALDLKFPAITGPTYTIRFEVKNEVAPGEGSHSLGYAGEHAGWLQLILTDTCPTTYDVYLGTTSPDTLVCADTPIPMCDPGPLAPGITYFWNVVSKGPAGENPGPTWSFTTAGIVEACSCDLDGSGGLCNFFDWLIFITDWGQCTQVGCSCDLNLDGSCNFFDWLVFITDWGNPDCPVPSRCAGQSCGTYTFDCNPQSPNCLCVKTAEGFGSCVPDGPCPPEQCTTSADCPSGFICAVGTCCGVGVCLEDNTCAPGGSTRSVPLDGAPTIGGR
jgi:Cys-rich repeat protein